jgi:iron(III) transport system substrate-binding protein
MGRKVWRTLALAWGLMGCGLWSGSETVVIYSGRGEALVSDLLERASRETGVAIQVQYGSTPELVTRALIEGAQSQADIVFAQEVGHFSVLADRGFLAPLPDEILGAVAPGFRDERGYWVGTSGRMRVLVVHQPSVPEGTRPMRLEDLAHPDVASRLGWAPSNGSFQAHIATLIGAWGPDRTRAFLRSVADGNPRTFTKNAPIARAVSDGELAMGWVNHYYLHQIQRGEGAAVNHHFVEGDPGNVMMVSGVGLRAGSPRAERAARVIAWLLTEEAQQAIAQDAWEYPMRPGVPTHDGVPPLETVGVFEAPFAHQTDLEPARAMLRDLGLL